MNKRFKVYRWILAGWMLLMGCVLSPAWAYTQAVPPASSSWGNMQRSGTAVAPSYQFQSTSPLLDGVTGTSDGYSPMAGAPSSRPNRTGGHWENGEWVEDDDNPIGVIPSPVGEPYILLVMAAVYLLFMRRRKRV